MPAASLVGLDIGLTSIRAVETTPSKDGPVVTNAAVAPLPAGAVQAGIIQDEKAVTLALKQLWAGARFRTRSVVLGVSNPQVVVREMSLTNLPQRALRKSLPYQVREALPLPVEHSLLDFHPLEDPGQNETVRGLLVAAPKDAVLTAVYAVERAGLHVARIDLASFALLRAISWLDTQVEALVDMGAQASNIVVHADGAPLIVRTIPHGGAEITELIAARLGVEPGEAEALKRRIGLRPEEGPEVAELVREACRPLFAEIRSSFAYLTSGGRKAPVARLVLSGGGSLLPGLIETLGPQLGVETLLADPTIRLYDRHRPKHEGLDHFRAAAAISIGLTLGAA